LLFGGKNHDWLLRNIAKNVPPTQKRKRKNQQPKNPVSIYIDFIPFYTAAQQSIELQTAPAPI
jgi:hypothetical protein